MGFLSFYTEGKRYLFKTRGRRSDHHFLNTGHDSLSQPCKTKNIAYPVKKPTCIEAWKNVLNIEISRKDACKVMHIEGKNPRQFYYRTVHEAWYCETRLVLMGKSNGICKLCNIGEENICHLLCNCTKIKLVLNNMEQIILDLIQVTITLGIKKIISEVNENLKVRNCKSTHL